MKSFEKPLPGPARATITGLTVLVTICFAGKFAVAGTISTGTALPQYSVVSVGSSASIMVNSGPILGKVLVGDGTTVTSAGGGSGSISSGVDASGTVHGDTPLFGGLETPPVVNIVSSTIATEAFTDAATLSAQASALTPTQTFGAINGTETITGNGGLNVINIASLHNPSLTLRGDTNDIFVINVSGSFDTNRAMVLQGVLASHILWNFTGTGTVLQTSGGNELFGTFLATQTGADFQFSALHLTGALINTGGHIQWVSNSRMVAFAPFIVPQQTVVPEPSSLLMLGTGLIAGAVVLRRKAAARFRHSARKVLGVEPMQVSELALSVANRRA